MITALHTLQGYIKIEISLSFRCTFLVLEAQSSMNHEKVKEVEWMSTKHDIDQMDAACHTEEGEHCRKSHHPEKVKKDMITRLNRVEGQIRGIKGMIEKDVYCDDVITQLAATQSALNSVAKILLEGHLKGCVVDRLGEGDETVLDELLVTIQKLMKK